MPGISKSEKARRQELAVRVEKAKESMLTQFGRLLAKHLPDMVKQGIDAKGTLAIHLHEGNATLRLSYQTTIEDHASFPLDDGQEELPMQVEATYPPMQETVEEPA